MNRRDREVTWCGPDARGEGWTERDAHADTEPPPAPDTVLATPLEDEHAHPAPVVRYCVTSDVDPTPRFMTFAEIVTEMGPPDGDRDAIRMLDTGESTTLHGMTFMRAHRVRVVVTYEIDAVDEFDPAAVVETLLDNGTPQDNINEAHENDPDTYGPMHVASAVQS